MPAVNIGGKQVTGEAAGALEAAVNNLTTAALQQTGEQAPEDRPYSLVISHGLNETTIRYDDAGRVQLSDAEERDSSNGVNYKGAAIVDLSPDGVNAELAWGTSFLASPSTSPYTPSHNGGTIEGNKAAGRITTRLAELSGAIGSGATEVQVQLVLPAAA